MSTIPASSISVSSRSPDSPQSHQPDHHRPAQGASQAREPRPIFDRGPRPVMRGRLHSAAAWYFGGTGTALTIVTLVQHGFSALSLATAAYALCLASMLSVSAIYHRAPWRTAGAVQAWRRADHSMIAVFIAGSYGPLTIAAFGSEWFTGWQFGNIGGLWILVAAWAAAGAAMWLNIAWIDHPRWLDAVVYNVLGWLAIVAPVGYLDTIGLGAGILILIGGIVYSLGAVIYALKWPNPSEQWFGFHEVFHAATIVAAGLHHVAMWIVVMS